MGRKRRRAGTGMSRERYQPGNWMSSGNMARRAFVTKICCCRGRPGMKRGAEECEQGAQRLRGLRNVQREVAASTWEKQSQGLSELEGESCLRDR